MRFGPYVHLTPSGSLFQTENVEFYCPGDYLEDSCKNSFPLVPKLEEIFKLIDADHDLKVSLKEFQKKPPEARFRQMDANDDGKLVFTEFKGRRKKAEQIERAERNFKRIDADGNKEVTLEEFKAAQKKRGERVGRNKRAKK